MELKDTGMALTRKLILKKKLAEIYSSFTGIGDASGPGRFRVLNYHSITEDLSIDDVSEQMTTPKSLLETHLKILRDNGYRVLTCADAVDMLLRREVHPCGSVCLTFDDGLRDNITNALPLMEKYGYPATIFLTLDFIGSDGYLSWDDIRAVSDSGIVTFGAHSATHRRLARIGADAIKREIVDAKAELEDKLAKRVDLFAYPFGSYGSFDGATIDALRSSGYRAAFTTIAGTNGETADPFKLRRTRISWFDDETEFPRELRGCYDWYSAWQMLSGSR